MSQPGRQSRRRFIADATTLGAAALLGVAHSAHAAEPPPETRKIRLVHTPAICLAPQYLAEELLRLEGFDEVEYVDAGNRFPSRVVADGFGDMTMDTAPMVVAALDSDQPVIPLAGLHAGCYELIGNQGIRAIRDLKGRSVAVSAIGAGDYIFLSSIAAYVGIDPRKDIRWMPTQSFAGSMRYFVDGTADAFLGFAPQPQELRAKGIGHVVMDTAQDRPWSQYFCCMVVANRQFATKYPVATRRSLRAILKATDICANSPERAARYLADKGYEPRYEVGLEVLKALPYSRWRDADPEDSLRFYALRLHEVGMIKTTPQKLIAQNTDWRFLNALKKELKA